MTKPKKLLMVSIAALLASCGGQSSSPTSSSQPLDSTGTSDSSHVASSSDMPSSLPDSNSSEIPSSVSEPEPEEPGIEESLVDPKANVTGNLDAQGKFYADYASLADEQKAARKTVVDIAAEGDVLLKNENHALPLSAEEKSVTLLGMRSVNLVNAGGGSGAGSVGTNGIAYTSLPDAFEQAGYDVNPSTINLYSAYQSLGIVANELPIANYTKSVIASYYGFSGAAILTFSREGTENSDLKTHDVVDHANPDDHILMLDDNEKALVKHAKEHFNKVIVLINTSNILEIPELAAKKAPDNYGVDAILWVGGVGNNGAEAIAKILDGSINPSGHTSDIWTANFKHDPSWTNFAYNSQNYDEQHNRLNAMLYDEQGAMTNFAQVEYREGLYNGYRYYETKAADMGGDEGETWYRSEVLYPFGFGLSYTQFRWELEGVKSKADIGAANQTVTVRVRVTNVGDVAGKDVVQVYYSAPYKKGGIEKSSNNLVNFGKTKLLQPGQSDVLTIQFVAQDMASFDYADKNNNGFKGYELEAGDYVITCNRDSHTPVLSMTRTVRQDMTLRKDYITGNDVDTIFSNEDDGFRSTTDVSEAHTISRADEGGLSQPKAATVEERKTSQDVLDMLEDQDVYNHYEIGATDPYYTDSVPSTWTQNDVKGINLADMSGIDYQDLKIVDGKPVEGTDEGSKKWTEFMNQVSWADMCTLVAGDKVKGPGSQAIPAIGKDADGYSNGPVQYAGGILFPSAPIIAATWNTILAYRMGRFVGNECIFTSNNLWAGPACNLHRSPFSGRNFEYYSQDGWHSARIVAEAIKGAVSKGTITLIKHFFLNDQESYRADYGGVITLVNEQVMREQYLKPFEWALKVGHSNGIMSSFNRIGYAVTANSYAVNQYLVRDEFGSKAVISTDAWAKDYVPVNLMALAGADQLDGSSNSYAKNALDYGTWDADKKMVLVKEGPDATENTMADPSLYFGIRAKCQRALYNRANSVAVKNGAIVGKTFEVVLEKGVANNVQITDDDAMFTIKEDPDSTANADALKAAGLSLKNNVLISGTPKNEGELTIPVTYSLDGWVSSSANLHIVIKSAIHVNDQPMATGVSAATYKASEKISMKVQVPALQYYTLIGNNLIVNAYQNPNDNSWMNRDEDKTAADIITIDPAIAKVKREYGYAVSNLPEGLEVKVVNKTVMGLANRTGYEVPDYILVEGTLNAGTYSFDVDLSYCTCMYMMTWLFPRYGCRLNHYTGTVTFTVE